jgi:hypothetical protein
MEDPGQYVGSSSWPDGDSMNFRSWCREKWYEHVDELISYGLEPQFTAQEYFDRYKFWLKREFKHQQGVK